MVLHRGLRDPRVLALREQLTRATQGRDTTRPQPARPESDCGRDGEVDGELFDDRLEHDVKAFQQRRGLVADGVVGAQTARVLDAAQWRLGDRVLLFTPGTLMRGDDVAALQERLLTLGLLSGPVDGRFGPRTDGALRDFQRSLGVAVDGVCGPATLRGLGGLSRSVSGGDPWALRQQAHVDNAGKSLLGKTVVLDPGAGEHEAAVTWDVVRRIAGRLEVTGVRTVLTRGHDGRPDDAARAELAERVGADVVLSVHCDRHDSPQAAGVATFYWGDEHVGSRSAVGHRLATLVQRELVARTGLLDCRTHPSTVELLRRTRMPTVWVDLGYVTNAQDRARLEDDAFHDIAADAVVAAVQRLYLGEDDAATGTLRLADVLGHAGLSGPAEATPPAS